jgi:hypothetical protein
MRRKEDKAMVGERQRRDSVERRRALRTRDEH